jgi:outer membrane receptor protein involved in Fe transport
MGVYKSLLLAGCAGSFALAAPALAQQTPDADAETGADVLDDNTPGLDSGQAPGADSGASTIVVTGSRIARRDFQGNSPIVTVDEALIKQSSTAAIEQNLNKLPQFTAVGNRTPTTGGGDIQPNATNTPGSSVIALRGIGSNRTLVLIDGRRATPANATGVVDINTIPTAAIERVEIISGGASSTYGADAVAGVTNFILKKNFTGFEIDAQAGISEEADGFEYQISGIMGTDFDDGRGNVSLSFSTNQRDSALQADRSWYQDNFRDPSIPSSGFFSPFGGINLGFGPNQPSPAVLNQVINGANFTTPPAGAVIYADAQGNAFSGFDVFGVPGRSGANFIDGYEYKVLDNGQIGFNNLFNYLISPLTRYNISARGNYEINDWIGVFANGYFSKTSSDSIQEGAPLTGGWAAMIDPTINREVIPTELLTILDSRPNPNAPFELRGLLPFNRTTENDVHAFNMTAGLEGSVPSTDWTWEAFVSHGESQVSSVLGGFASLQRTRFILNQPNFGRGFSYTGNPDFGGFGGNTATCTSGLNLFRPDTISDDCMQAIRADIQTKSTVRQTIAEANLQGGLLEMPAGQLRFAAGASYRENEYEFINDTLTTQGTSFLDQALGLYPAGNSNGLITSKEVYGELLIPVLADIPFIQELNLEVGGRMSDYNTTGTSWTYKILGDWQVTDWLRFRGGYNRAERAPNIAELYLAPEQTFGAASGGDLCSINNLSPYSANPDANPTGFSQALALCGALMERSGDATTDQQFYGTDYRNLLGATNRAELAALVTNTGTQGSGLVFAFPTLKGNPDLRPETADTWTAGAVIRSPFTSPLLQRLSLAIDYYNIKVSDAIGVQSIDIVQRQCFDPAFNPTLDPDQQFCQAANRNQAGALDDVARTYLNSGRFRTSGIDVALNWSFDVGPGQVNLNSIFNYLIEMKAAELPVDPMIDYTGTLGPSINGLNGGSYEYKIFTTLGYSWGRTSLGVEWRHLPSIKAEAAARFPTTTTQGVPTSYNVFALNGSVGLTDDLNIRFGVENLFNKRPPLSGRNTNPPPGVLPGGSFNAGFYDVIGRRFYLGANAKF